MARLKVLKMYKPFIDGRFSRTESVKYLSAINPKTKEKICNYLHASGIDSRLLL